MSIKQEMIEAQLAGESRFISSTTCRYEGCGSNLRYASGKCVPCNARGGREQYANNTDYRLKSLAKSKAHQKKNPEMYRAYSKKYRIEEALK